MFSRKFFSRLGLIVVILLIMGVAAYFIGKQFAAQAAQSISPSAIAPSIDDFPVITKRSEPVSIEFNGCPPAGQGGDSELNLLENRVDEGRYTSITFDTLLALRWPKDIERQAMSAWSPENDAYITQYLGMPVLLTGYLLLAKEAPPSPANCSRNNFENADWNLSLINNLGDNNAQAILAEVTPRVRWNHKWNLDTLRTIIYEQLQVRVGGWLLFNPDHPGDVGIQRATLWEIHPVMQIEILQNGHWVTLDKFTP